MPYNDYVSKRPEGAPKCWRVSDFQFDFIYGMDLANLPFPINNPPPNTVKGTMEIKSRVNLRAKLDYWWVYKLLSNRHKKHLRNHVLQEFSTDILHATEIIDGYGLSE